MQTPAVNPETALSAASENKQTAVSGLYSSVYISVTALEHQQDMTDGPVSFSSFETSLCCVV